MLRWIAGVIRANSIRNEKIRGHFGIAPTADKLRETRLRWYEHVLLASEDSVCQVGLDLEVLGKRPRRSPEQRWLDKLDIELMHVGAHPDQAHSRAKVHQKIREADLANERNKLKEE
ncbi:hypothetical protein ANCDUO_23373 [Ancylostoma duodenale]|uniref:Uncharacterized protein n=1 Tax=Ancylostoma duodenale TaxID=51022 RepID=A0A0C2BRW2_9BILA|nr:hypothetical protein ANCDUO_23373 [Ancylostoma duodenale]